MSYAVSLQGFLGRQSLMIPSGGGETGGWPGHLEDSITEGSLEGDTQGKRKRLLGPAFLMDTRRSNPLQRSRK